MYAPEPRTVFTDFGEVRQEIEAETARTLGAKSKAVSSEPIMVGRSRTLSNSS